MKLYIVSVIFILVNFGTFAETLSDSLLCNKATMQKGDITSWDTSNQFRFEYVMEAKKRGSECGVSKSTSKLGNLDYKVVCKKHQPTYSTLYKISLQYSQSK